MNEIAAQATALIYGQGPFEDHHGGALWLQDSQGWFMVRNQAGIEWFAQFCLSGAEGSHPLIFADSHQDVFTDNFAGL
jgi:hypothetical protein